MKTEVVSKKFKPQKPALFEKEIAKLIKEKLPPLSADWKEKMVTALPWILLVFVLISLPALLVAMGLGFGVSVFIVSIKLILLLVLSLVLFVANCIAIPMIFKRKRLGWVILYLSNLLNVFLAVVDFNFFSLLFGLFFIYLIFQVREYYGSPKDYQQMKMT